jgi:hypothetical protein
MSLIPFAPFILQPCCKAAKACYVLSFYVVDCIAWLGVDLVPEAKGGATKLARI